MNPIVYWFRYFLGMPVRRYDELPGSRQWSPNRPDPVDPSRWRPCAGCHRLIPMDKDFRRTQGASIEFAGTHTYVCPFCGYCHVGTPSSHPDTLKQVRCHECSSELGTADACPKCSFPRGWMRVNCPHCGNRQPVSVPHWVDHCDMFHLECVQCGFVFDSFCIC